MKRSEQGFALVQAILIAVVAGIVAFTGWYVIHASHNVQNSLNQANNAKNANPKKKSVASQPQTTATNSSTQSKASSVSAPFSISKVYFSQAPKTPAGAGFMQCHEGQQVNYTAVADLTATAAGTAAYHWELADQFDASVQKFENSSIRFESAGTKQVTKTFTYTVRNVGNGNNLNTRQFLNVFVTSPNSTYANKGHEVYAYGNDNNAFFAWGTYIDLC